MKFNIEIELDYLEEDGTVDESMQEQIKWETARYIASKYTPSQSLTQELAMSILKERINAEIKEIIDSFAQKPITIKENYTPTGYTSAISYLTERFNALADAEFAKATVGNFIDDTLKREIRQMRSNIEEKAKYLLKVELANNPTMKMLTESLNAINPA